MVDVYSFVLDADPLKSNGVKDRTKAFEMLAMAAQMTECAYFIRVYVKKRGFCMSVFRVTSNRSDHLISDADSQIQAYQNKFTELHVRCLCNT